MSPRILNGLLPTHSDARLARLVGDGNERAFDVIVARYRRPLRSYCQRMLSEGLAEDVVQQTFMRTWSALRDGLEIRDLRPWLYRVAHNAAINTLKRAGYHHEQLEESQPGHDAPHVHVERKAQMESVLAHVAALPLSQREALLRTAVNGESRSDVARHLGTTEGAVGQLLYRARTTLRAAASALIPLPLLSWGSRSASSGGPGARITELMGGGGGAGLAGLVVKGGAVLATAGAMAGVPIAVHHFSAPPPPRSAAALTASPSPRRAGDVPLLAQLMAAPGPGGADALTAGLGFAWRGGQGGATGQPTPRTVAAAVSLQSAAPLAGSPAPAPGSSGESAKPSRPDAGPSATASADSGAGAGQAAGDATATGWSGSADRVSADQTVGVSDTTSAFASTDASTSADSAGSTDASNSTDGGAFPPDSGATSSGSSDSSSTDAGASSPTDGSSSSATSTDGSQSSPPDSSPADPAASPAGG